MTSMRNVKTVSALALAMGLSLVLGGCYKTDFENEKKKTADLTSQLDAMKSQLDGANRKVSEAQVAVNAYARLQQGGMTLSTFGWNNGQMAEIGRDGVKINTQGQLVRHGERRRENGALRFNDGFLADQNFALNRSGTATKYVEGTIKGGKADGQWIWYSKDGKATHRETYAAGKLQMVETITTARDGKQTFKKMTEAQKKSFFTERAPVFASIPELDRSL